MALLIMRYSSNDSWTKNSSREEPVCPSTLMAAVKDPINWRSSEVELTSFQVKNLNFSVRSFLKSPFDAMETLMSFTVAFSGIPPTEHLKILSELETSLKLATGSFFT